MIEGTTSTTTTIGLVPVRVRRTDTHTDLRLAYGSAACSRRRCSSSTAGTVAVDNNTGKSLPPSSPSTPSPRLSASVSYMGGPEQANENANVRHALDVVATFKAAPSVSLAVNYDYGRESSVPLAGTAGGGVADASWQGVAGYGRVTISPRAAITLRAEWFDDRRARTGYVQSLRSSPSRRSSSRTPASSSAATCGATGRIGTCSRRKTAPSAAVR